MSELEKFPYLEQEMDRILHELESEPCDEELALASYESVKNKLNISAWPYRIKETTRWAQRIAAILFIPAIVGASLLLSVNKSNSEITWSEVSVPTGQTRDVTLPDGTELVLNSGSRVTFPSKFAKKSRDIFFDGEVYANVAKNPKKPFIIHSKGIDVKVLGTTFDFKSYNYANYAELLLLEGSVQMEIEKNGSNKTYLLTPGDLLQYQKDAGTVDRKTINVDSYKPFCEDRSIHFYNIPMKEIALELERRFDTRIVIRDKAIEETKFLAFFTNNETLDDMMASFCAGNSITATKSNGVIYLDKK